MNKSLRQHMSLKHRLKYLIQPYEIKGYETSKSEKVCKAAMVVFLTYQPNP